MGRVIFEVAVANVKVSVLRVVELCSLVYRRFRSVFYLLSSLVAMMIEAAGVSETSVSFYQTARCSNSEDDNIQNDTQ